MNPDALEMQIQGAIYPAEGAVAFTREAWVQLVATRPEFRRREPRQAPNPFTGKMMNHPTPTDAAEVVLQRAVVGNVYWSMSDEPLVNVSLMPSALRLVEEWAATLGGTFRPDGPQ